MFLMTFRLLVGQLNFKLSNPNTVQNGRLYLVFSFCKTTCFVTFCSLFMISVIYLQWNSLKFVCRLTKCLTSSKQLTDYEKGNC